MMKKQLKRTLARSDSYLFKYKDHIYQKPITSSVYCGYQQVIRFTTVIKTHIPDYNYKY